MLEHAVELARFGGQLGVLAVALDIYASLLCEHGEHDQAKATLREARSYPAAAGRAPGISCASSAEGRLVWLSPNGNTQFCRCWTAT